ncbi:MAG: YqaA family protein [Magnetospiraceae bacterium]
MLRRLYDWTLSLAAHPQALWWMAAISFVESSFFPIPPDLLLIPMVLADRAKAWIIATVCTVSSVLGGVAGYLIGVFLYEAVAQPVLAFYGYADQFAEFQGIYNEWGAWLVAGAGLTPFPYKIITILSGVVDMNFLAFMLASVVGRGGRFYLEAGLLWYFGAPIRSFIEAHLGKLTILFFVLLLGGFLLVKVILP